MGFFKNLQENGDLFGAMLDRTGTRDDQRIMRMTGTELRSAFFRCVGCRNADACSDFIAMADPSEPTPDFCRNKALMDSLAS